VSPGSGSGRFPLLLPILLLLTLCAGLSTLHMGRIPFLGKDEPKNAEALREMMERGDWVTTTLREEPWFDKPILYYWVSLIFFHLLGPGETAARLGPALFGAGGVLLTFAFARFLFDGKTALRAGVILATSLEYFWFSRTAVVDLPLAFCVTLSLVAIYRAMESPANSAGWYRLAFAATGGAVLAKGPVGIALPGLVTGAYLLASRRLSELRRVPWLSGLLCFLLVAGPWYLVVSLRHGRRFWDDFIINRNVERYLSTIHHHPGPFYYYLPVLVIGLFPWGGILPFAVGKIFAAGWRDLAGERRRFGYLLLWVLLPLLFFSFAGSKLPSYLLPCFPALAILLAWGWGAVLEAEPGASAPMRRWAMAGLLLVFPILAGAIYLWCRTEAPEQIPAQLPLALALATTASLLGLAAARGKFRLLFPVCAACTTACLTFLILFSLGNVREEASLTRISAEAVRLSRSGSTVVAYRAFHNYLFYYTENRVPWVKKRPELDGLLREKGSLYCFLEPEALKELGSDPAVRLEVVDRQYKVTLARVTLVSGEPKG
jgi:4-amino-4-deoxy-L-arabinose transferase-like glycosyltransferase